MNRDGDRTVDSGGAVRLLTREDDCDGDGDGSEVMGIGASGTALRHPGTGTAPSAGSSETITGHHPVSSPIARSSS